MRKYKVTFTFEINVEADSYDEASVEAGTRLDEDYNSSDAKYTVIEVLE